MPFFPVKMYLPHSIPDSMPSRCLKGLILTLLLTFPAYAENKDSSLRSVATYLSQHGYGAVDISDSLLHAEINGKDSLLNIDTGFPTDLSYDLARRIHLDINDSGTKSWWLSGPFAHNSGVALVKSFTVNAYEINRTSTIPVLPKLGEPENEFGGRFGFDFLHLNSAILFMDQGVFFYKPGNGSAVPVSNFMLALGLKPMPMAYGETGLTVQGKLDGHPISAHVCTAFLFSEFDRDYLNRVGEPSYKTYHQFFTDEGFVTGIYRLRPTDLEFGPITIAPIYFGAFETPLFSHYACNMLLGEDILAQHHAVIDFGNNILWMK